MASATGRWLGLGVKIIDYNWKHSMDRNSNLHLNKTGDKIQSVWDALQLKDVENFKVEQKEQAIAEVKNKQKIWE